MLTVLQQKLAEAHGLGVVATEVAARVERLTGEGALRRELRTMREESEATRARCRLVEEHVLSELVGELRAHTTTIHEKGLGLIEAWFKAGTDPLHGWTFLAMAEAAEVASWSGVDVLAAHAGGAEIAELAEWALAVQQRHLSTALAGVVRLASTVDPAGPRWG